MPRGRGATRPGRGSDARDGAHPGEREKAALSLAHGSHVGLLDRKVKLRIVAAQIAEKRQQRDAFSGAANQGNS